MKYRREHAWHRHVTWMHDKETKCWQYVVIYGNGIDVRQAVGVRRTKAECLEDIRAQDPRPWIRARLRKPE